MTTKSLLGITAAILSVATSAPAAVQTMHFDMPEPVWVFGQEWHNDYFEFALEGTIVDARLVVTFDTQNAPVAFHDAADILFQFQIPTTELPFWNVSGEDLGWSGTGSFSASISTDAFNGQSLISDGDFILWFGRIVSRNDALPQLGGALSNSYWEFDVQIVPAPHTTAIAAIAFGCLGRRRR